MNVRKESGLGPLKCSSVTASPMSQVYAERDMARAATVAAKIG